MNVITRLSLASIMLASSSTMYAVEPDDGWYAGLIAGASYLNELNFGIVNPPFLLPLLPPPAAINLTSDFTYKLGFDGGIQAGYRWCENFRFEGQVFVNYNKIEKIQLPGIGPIRSHQNPLGFSISGNTGMLAGFFNAYYDLYTPGSTSSIVPYVGVGIGYAYLRTKFDFNYLGKPIIGSQFQTSDTAPIGQGILGLSYFFDETVAVGVDFRYLTTNKIKDLDERATVESINFVLNFSFDQPGE